MSGAAVIFGLLGSAVSAVGSIVQGNAQAQAHEYNAQALKQQAVQERDAAAAEASDFRRQEHRKVSAAAAARGATGVTGAGSPLLVDEATVREVALGASRLLYAGKVKSNRLMDERELEKMSAKSARTAGYFGAGTSLLSGLGSFA